MTGAIRTRTRPFGKTSVEAARSLAREHRRHLRRPEQQRVDAAHAQLVADRLDLRADRGHRDAMRRRDLARGAIADQLAKHAALGIGETVAVGQHLQPERQKKIAEETLEIYAPIAHRLGMGKIRGELEDLGFRFLDPLGYEQVEKAVNARRKQSLSIRWILAASRGKSGRPMAQRLAEEFMAAYRREGEAMTKRENTIKMAESNKAFAHFAW